MTFPHFPDIADPVDRGDPDRVADLASLRALLACVRLELGGGRDLIPCANGWIEPRSRQPLQTGQPRLHQLIRHEAEGCRAVDVSEVLALILDRIARDHGAAGATLVRRVRASRQRIAELAAHRLSVPDAAPDFLTAEQALIFGHWMHPCPKALTGITLSEERAMTPDWRGALRLHALSVRADLVESTDQALVRDLPGMNLAPIPGRTILPVHPLTWDRACRDPQIATLVQSGDIVDLGPTGPGWWATSSVRTLWRGDSPWQVKVSLPVTVTNSRRVNKRHELLAGATMARRLTPLNGRFGPLRIVTDPHWMTLRLAGRAESGLELILRQNPWRGARGGMVMQVAGLVAEPLPGRASILSQVVAGHDPGAWFDAYLDCAVAPLLRLYDATGIAVEAHQQNALLDLSGGLPCRCDIRDNQAFYVAEDMADTDMRAIAQLVYPRSDCEDALTYTLIVNQVFSVIHRLALDGLLPEDRALSRLALHLAGLDALPGHGGALARRWLTAPHLPAKGNLLTQLGGVDELLIPGERAPMIYVPNPLPAHVRERTFADVA